MSSNNAFGIPQISGGDPASLPNNIEIYCKDGGDIIMNNISCWRSII